MENAWSTKGGLDVEGERAARMCPRCGEDSIVYDSREQLDGSIRRWRKCKVCGAKFSTLEKFEKFL